MDFLFLFDDLTVDGFSLLMFSGESCQKELIVLVTDTWSSNVLTVEQFGDDNCSFLAPLDDRWLVGLFVNDSWSIGDLTGEQFEIDLDLLLAGSRREVCERSQGRMQAGA